MIKRTVCLLVMGLILSACAVGPLPQRGGPIAWDGLGRDPNLPAPLHRQRLATTAPTIDPTAGEDALLASLPPKSSEWFAAQRRIDADRDKRLAAKLVICRGCSELASKSEPSAVARPSWISEIR
ncbi:hypothetical protein [Bradyrhizobium genosp. A]|uniref:hypothetical protein n=1 Tax=Bradyrhizobium genosp. A TaxID=83626 RepID=UPI003CEC4EFC